MRRATRFRVVWLSGFLFVVGLFQIPTALGGSVDVTSPDSSQPAAADCTGAAHVFGTADSPVEPCHRQEVPTGRGADTQFLDNAIRDLGQQPATGSLNPGDPGGTAQPAPPANSR